MVLQLGETGELYNSFKVDLFIFSFDSRAFREKQIINSYFREEEGSHYLGTFDMLKSALIPIKLFPCLTTCDAQMF